MSVDSKPALTEPIATPVDRGLVFLDRDGVINRDSRHFIRGVDDWNPILGSLDAIARMSRAGFRVVIVTNQSGLARGLISKVALEEIHATLESSVVDRGGRIDGILYCPHGPGDRCACRKPAPGLLERAGRERAIDVTNVPFVGDRVSDLIAARRAACRPVFVRSGATREEDLGAIWDDVERFDDLAAFADALI